MQGHSVKETAQRGEMGTVLLEATSAQRVAVSRRQLEVSRGLVLNFEIAEAPPNLVVTLQELDVSASEVIGPVLNTVYGIPQVAPTSRKVGQYIFWQLICKKSW